MPPCPPPSELEVVAATGASDNAVAGPNEPEEVRARSEALGPSPGSEDLSDNEGGVTNGAGAAGVTTGSDAVGVTAGAGSGRAGGSGALVLVPDSGSRLWSSMIG